MTVLTGLVQTVHQLYAARFLLGLAEAGYFPGITLYLTYWFRQRERAQASAVGAPLSAIILDHVNWLGVSSWRWLLILEGLPAVVCGLLTYFLLPNRPAEARFLNEEEKDWISSELSREERQKLAKHPVSAVQVFTNGRVWHLICIGFALFVSVYTINFWAPQLVKSLLARYSNTVIGLVVMVPNLAAIPAMFFVSRSSDRKLERRYHAAIPAIVGGAAFLLLGTTHSAFVSVRATIACGCRSVQFLRPLLRSPMRIPGWTFSRLGNCSH